MECWQNWNVQVTSALRSSLRAMRILLIFLSLSSVLLNDFLTVTVLA